MLEVHAEAENINNHTLIGFQGVKKGDFVNPPPVGAVGHSLNCPICFIIPSRHDLCAKKTVGGLLCVASYVCFIFHFFPAAMADFDAILEEELDKLDMDMDPSSTSDFAAHFFPDSKDCDCCHGYMLTCPCTLDGSPDCEKCSNPLTLPQPEVQPSAAFPANNPFSRTVQASATAVMNSTAPTLTRAPSVTSTQDIFNFSVKMYPPPSSVLSRDMFKMMFLPGVRSALAGQTEAGSSSALGWPDRGWRTQQEFETEVEVALQSRAYNISGIFVARKLSEEEANDLVNKLNEIEVRNGPQAQYSAP
jgi:hypothetical protein